MPRPVPAADDAPGLHPVYARLLLALLARQGVPTAPLLAEAGLAAAALDGDETPVPAGKVQALVAAAMRESGRPWLGLEFGAGGPLLSHGALGQAAAASGSLRQALELAARFIGLRAPMLRLSLRESGDGLSLRLEPTVALSPEVRRFVLEASLLMLERLLQALSGRDFGAARVELPWPAPAWAPHYPAFFSATPRFGARHAGLRLPAALADAPCLTADPRALAEARAECERRLAAGSAGRDLVAALRRRLLRCEGAYPDAATVAAEQGLPLRSFYRALAREGVAWRELLDEARRERARGLLLETTLPIEAIAERLGYADASNFARCVRRWFGTGARELRRRAGLSART